MATVMKKPSLFSEPKTKNEDSDNTPLATAGGAYDSLWDDPADDDASPVQLTEQAIAEGITDSEGNALEDDHGNPISDEVSPEASEATADNGTPEADNAGTEAGVGSQEEGAAVVDAPVVAVSPRPVNTTWNRIQAEIDAEIKYEERREALTEYFVACATTRAKLEAELKVAKKKEKDALEELTEHIDDGPKKPEPPAPMPLFDRGNAPLPPATNNGEATDVAADSGDVVSTAAEPEAPDGNPDAWRLVSIAELSLSESLTERLIEDGIATIGNLEDRRAEIANGKAKWPKGIGEKKQTDIENAVVEWLTKNRDSHLFGQVVPVTPVEESAPEVATGESTTAEERPGEATAFYPTEDEWDNMSDDAQTEWLNARSVQLDSDNLDELKNRVAEGCDDFFTDGCDAYSEGDLICNCGHPPGPECDAWILGWLWQGKQDDEQEGGEGT